MKSGTIGAVAGAAMVVFSAAAAHAGVIDFEGPVGPITAGLFQPGVNVSFTGGTPEIIPLDGTNGPNVLKMSPGSTVKFSFTPATVAGALLTADIRVGGVESSGYVEIFSLNGPNIVTSGLTSSNIWDPRAIDPTPFFITDLGFTCGVEDTCDVDNITFTQPPVVVNATEPGTFAVLGLGFVGLAAVYRRRQWGDDVAVKGAALTLAA